MIDSISVVFPAPLAPRIPERLARADLEIHREQCDELPVAFHRAGDPVTSGRAHAVCLDAWTTQTLSSCHLLRHRLIPSDDRPPRRARDLAPQADAAARHVPQG
ncbi:hypothetical protein D9T14_01045 [Propionibacterium australiense]|nr:hypothetical protein D9T14_01045 [Propionibacterium australiense]